MKLVAHLEYHQVHPTMRWIVWMYAIAMGIAASIPWIIALRSIFR